uniref:NADH-ubiquinone oxidoreductase chain 4 n=1 Tax=Octostigma sinensis TaxID=211997 RepID=U3KTH3_9HEXA|nr:NADH dehydrogenase subunit 4 [Octostigma sinensis]AEV44842.1 NADH dehydrogenase subunit 4 [Octostigma sinensis]
MLKYLFGVLFLIMVLGESMGVVQNFIFFFSGIFLMETLNYYHSCVGFYYAMDSLSFCMLMLSFWILGLMFMSSEGIYKSDFHCAVFNMVLLFMLFFLLVAFFSMNLLIFYIFFEASLVPTVLLVFGWGYQPERVQAGIYLLFYTFFVSLPMLVGVIYMMYGFGSLDFYFFSSLSVWEISSFLWYMCMILAFLVKMPMYMFHLWLPKAHVEAPISGSMILAGILLKLGGYGLMRLLMIFSRLNLGFSWFWMGLGVFGGSLVSFVCLRQIDLKSLIAYSSVVHMGLVLGGLMSMTKIGLCGGLIVMVGHGLCSSGLFCLANISYERYGSRSMMISKSMMGLMPSMSLWWFMLGVGNMGAPPSLNLLGEINLMISLMSWENMMFLSLVLVSFFGACYTLYLYSVTQHGKGMFSFLFSGISVREYLLVFLHWFPLNFLVVKSEVFIW